MHLGDPAAALRRFARHLVPGGRVAFQEVYLDGPEVSLSQAVPLWAKGLGWATETFRRERTDPQMGLKLYEAFRHAGLPPPEVRLEVHLITASDPSGPRLAAHTLRSILPLAERFGVATAEEMDIETFEGRLRDEVAASDAVITWPPFVSAWSRMGTSESTRAI